MNWKDQGYLISKNNYNENSLVVIFFTKQRGCVHGIIYGGTSRKIKNYLLIGNKLDLNYKSKNENRIGYFKSEILNPISAMYFNKRKKITAILSATSFLKILLAENQPYIEIFNSFENFILNLNKNDWLFYYAKFEFSLIQNLGYGVDLSKDKDSNTHHFFKDKKSMTISDIKNALFFNKKLIMKNYLDSHNLKFPIYRTILEKYLI